MKHSYILLVFSCLLFAACKVQNESQLSRECFTHNLVCQTNNGLNFFVPLDTVMIQHEIRFGCIRTAGSLLGVIQDTYHVSKDSACVLLYQLLLGTGNHIPFSPLIGRDGFDTIDIRLYKKIKKCNAQTIIKKFFDKNGVYITQEPPGWYGAILLALYEKGVALTIDDISGDIVYITFAENKLCNDRFIFKKPLY